MVLLGIGTSLPVFVHSAQFTGDVGNIRLGKNAGITGQPARVEVSGTNDVFDPMQGDAKPSGNLAHGWHRRDGLEHGASPIGICLLSGAEYTESFSRLPREEA
jgi:hypothetical protein